MEPLISIYPSHDSSLCIRTEDGKFRIFEFERLLKERFARIDNKDNYKEVYNSIKTIIKNECGIDNFKTCYQLHLPKTHEEYLKEIFKIEKFVEEYHHVSHANCAFYQSLFQEALVISYDGGGFDGGSGDDRVTYFNIFHASRNGKLKRLKYIPYDLGTSYGLLALPISEITKTEENWGERFLGFAGKIMGLCAYSKPKLEWLDAFKEFYKQHKHVGPIDLKKTLSKKIDLSLDINSTQGELSYQIAATSQLAFEEIIFEELKPFFKQYKLPVVLTGGCALNVILNQKLRDILDVPVFVPPNPSDCGLALGFMLNKNSSQEPIDIMYEGFPILDKVDLLKYAAERNAVKITIPEIAKLLSEGKILGLMRGNSECGPRALGNRSILCDPSIADMKDTLNHKVKFRESFRPFAPMVKLEEVDKYFNFSGEAAFMSYSPTVKPEWKNKIPAVVHQDDTARVQTVDKNQNPYIHDLLTEFDKLKQGVILNTSFNIKGKPILTTIEDALEVLDTTELDGIIVEDYFFEKRK